MWILISTLTTWDLLISTNLPYWCNVNQDWCLFTRFYSGSNTTWGEPFVKYQWFIRNGCLAGALALLRCQPGDFLTSGLWMQGSTRILTQPQVNPPLLITSFRNLWFIRTQDHLRAHGATSCLFTNARFNHVLNSNGHKWTLPYQTVVSAFVTDGRQGHSRTDCVNHLFMNVFLA